jgi:predicted CopG family antitoxin
MAERKMKRLTIDLPDDVYKKLMKIQFDEFVKSGTKPSLREILTEFVNEGLDRKEKASQN